MRTRTRRQALPAMLLVIGLALSACGGDDDDAAAEADPVSEDSAVDGAETVDGGAGDGVSSDETTAPPGSDDSGANASASEFQMTVSIEEPADWAGEYTLDQLDPDLSSFICFADSTTGFSLLMGGLAEPAPLSTIEVNSPDQLSGPGTYAATGTISTQDFVSNSYFTGEVTIESSDDTGSSGVFQLLPDDNNSESPAVSGSWSCESGG